MNVANLLSMGTTFLADGVNDADTVINEGLNTSLSDFMDKLVELMNTIWPWIIGIMALVVVVWGIYIGVKIAIAHRNEDQVNARAMVRNLIIGIIVMFVVAVGAPLLIEGLAAWV